MSTTASTTEKIFCPTCGSEMPPRPVQLCSVCRSYTKQWKNTFEYFGKVVGGIAIVASGAVFITGQAMEWYRLWTWNDAVQAVYFEYPGLSGFLNTGSGDVVLYSMTIEWPGDSGRGVQVGVHQLLRKGEFLKFEAVSPYGRPNNADPKGDTKPTNWAGSTDGVAKPDILEQAIDNGRSDRCAEYHFYNEDSVAFHRIAHEKENENPRRKLVTTDARMLLNFISLHAKGPSDLLEVPIKTAFLYIHANPGCSGDY